MKTCCSKFTDCLCVISSYFLLALAPCVYTRMASCENANLWNRVIVQVIQVRSQKSSKGEVFT